MFNDGVHDPAALLESAHGGSELHDQPTLHLVGHETVDQTTTQLIAEENARQEAVRQASRDERARQNEANRHATLDNWERQRRPRGQLPLQQCLPIYEDPKEDLDYLEQIETGDIIPPKLP